MNDLKKHVKDILQPVKINLEDIMKVNDQLLSENQSLKDGMSELVKEIRDMKMNLYSNKGLSGLNKTKSNGNLKVNR